MIMLIRKVKFYVRPSCRASDREIVSGANHVSEDNSLFYLLTVASTDRYLLSLSRYLLPPTGKAVDADPLKIILAGPQGVYHPLPISLAILVLFWS